jgi:hypothetical protein
VYRLSGRFAHVVWAAFSDERSKLERDRNTLAKQLYSAAIRTKQPLNIGLAKYSIHAPTADFYKFQSAAIP